MSLSPARPFAVGDAVRLVSCHGEPIPAAEQLRAVIQQLPGEVFDGGSFVLQDVHVVFPMPGEPVGGYDFWPLDEIALDAPEG